MSTPLVSISCITYNHASYIRECLEGFLMQKTNFLFEVLIHDDASTDGTADIIREYAAKYPDIIKPILQTENQYSKGLRAISATFNFPRAQGKYIALCEGDDFWTDPHKLQIQFDFMESHPDYSMCFHNAKELLPPGISGQLLTRIENRDYSGVEILKQWTIPTASTLFRRDSTINVPKNKDFWCGDIVLWLTICRKGKIRGLAQEMSVYRVTKQGALNRFFSMDFAVLTERLRLHFTALHREFPEIVTEEYLRGRLFLLDYDELLQIKEKFGTLDCLKKWLSMSVPQKFKVILFYLQYRRKVAMSKKQY